MNQLTRIRRGTALLLVIAICLIGGGTQRAGAIETNTPIGPPARVSPRETQVAERLLAGLLATEDAIDITDIGLPTTALGAVYTALLHSQPALFHVAPRFSYAYIPSSDASDDAVVTVVYPSYTLTGQDLSDARRDFRDAISGILDSMETAFAGRTRTEAETVLYLHDYLADRYDYDTRTTPNITAYTLFRDGVGVCQAYALAYLALCRAAGLEADLVVSPDMDHAWNHVRIGEEWYHVDVTRDDPIPAPGGKAAVTHDRLLRSDAGMAALGYTNFSCAGGHMCTDTRYEIPADGPPAIKAVLHAYRTPLIPLPSGEITLWLAPSEGPITARLGDEGAMIHAPGDIDGDGRITPADLLLLRDPAVPETLRDAVREAIVEKHRGARTSSVSPVRRSDW